MAQTKSQIGVKALQRLKVLEDGATASSSDTTSIEAAYDEVYANLRTKHLVSWGSTGSVPNEAVDAIVTLVAALRVNEFDPPDDVAIKIIALASAAEGALSVIIQPDYVSSPVQANYF